MAELHFTEQVPSTGVIYTTWEGLETGDTGEPVEFPRYADKTVQVVGTFDAATVTMQGSNDGTNWATLKDNFETNIAITAATVLHTIVNSPRFIRPIVSGGTTVDVDVLLVSRGK